MSAVTPLMVKTPNNPDGTPVEVFDGFPAALAANRAQFYRDVPARPFYGFNRSGAKPLEDSRRRYQQRPSGFYPEVIPPSRESRGYERRSGAAEGIEDEIAGARE